MPRFDPVWLLLGGVAVFLATLGAMPLVPGYGAACALFLLGGLGIAMFTNLQTTIGLSEAPFAMRSRVMGLISTCIGTWPLGMLLSGALADQIGPLWALCSMGIAGLTLLAAVGGHYAHRRR